ncbi:hypothetical protein B7P43_G14831, partial [Cryptotermes secundus]
SSIEWQKIAKDFERNMNFVFVADEAFALRETILNPFPRKDLTHESNDIVKACVVLRNFPRRNHGTHNAPGSMLDREELEDTSVVEGDCGGMSNLKDVSINFAVCAR